MTLDPKTKAVLDLTFSGAPPDPVLARMTALFARCWPDSVWDSELHPVANTGENFHDAADRLGLSWSPGWLEEVGYQGRDAGGNPMSTTKAATVTGPIDWSPTVRLPRVDDGVSDDYRLKPSSTPHRRRLAGEVALAALWRDAAAATGIAPTIRATGLVGGTRGARFRDSVAYVTKNLLTPAGPAWDVRTERPMKDIFGMHLRRNVGDRKTDAIVLDGDRLTALISCKWSWRSDRGTEGAQIGRLRRYRPDVPYVSVTSEFPRAAGISRESEEDHVYFLAPLWIGTWLAVNEAVSSGGNPRVDFPTVADLKYEGRRVSSLLQLEQYEELAAGAAGASIF